MTKKRASAIIVFTFVLLALTSRICFSQEAVPEIVILTVYPDGFVQVSMTAPVDKTFPTQNITVYGQVLEDLIVYDANDLPLGYTLNGSILSVYSLGTQEIGVTYLTQDLTAKEGRYWTLTLDATNTTRIILPQEATIISLNKVPEMIETSSDKVTLLMGAGSIEVTYVVGVVGTQEHAQIILDETEATINAINNLGIIIADAETKLAQALDAFDLGNYAEAETLGNQAKSLAIQINQTAAQAQSKIATAQTAVANAQNEGRTTGLANAEELLSQASSAYELGDYSGALSLAAQAIMEANQSALSLSEESEAFPLLEVLVVALILASTVIGLVLLKSRRKPKEAEPKQKRQVDIERIFKAHKDLMPEEKQAIQFLADNNGEAFEAELYDYVKLPRTTTWRMVKRLKNMDIITVTKFRRQNLVRLKTKYDIKE